MQIQNYANLSVEKISALEDELAGRENLLQILKWNNLVVDSIAQDEFTRDVVIRWQNELFLVFDAT
ncbi:MAG: hypothetical protein ABI954_02050 [Pyrinomonadaceae bacterium]